MNINLLQPRNLFMKFVGISPGANMNEGLNNNFENVIFDLTRYVNAINSYKIDLTKDVVANGTSGQVLTSQGTSVPIWAAIPASNGLPRPDTRRVFWINNRPGAAANDAVGFDVAQITVNTANSTIVMDADAAWAQFVTTATAGASAGLSILAVKYIIVDQLPIYSIKIKTDTSIANLRFWFGIVSAGFTNADTLGATKGIAFRYSTVAADPGWVGVVSDGAAQTVTSNVANIATSTVYTLTIKVTSTTSASFSVNSGTAVTATIPAGVLGTNLTIDQEVFTTENVAKTWRGGLFYLEAN